MWTMGKAAGRLVRSSRVGGVGVEGELEELVGFAASTFPPVDVADRSEDGCCVL